MNKQESDILNTLLLEPFINQRILAEVSGHSLGVVNRSLKELIKADYLDESIRPTVKAITEFKQKTPQRAIILAAGFGMRMVPINTEMPKGLLEVNGEPLIERIIKQLHEVGIEEIYVVVGFMKEKYEYLIDEYGVELVVNADYASKNNLHSVRLAFYATSFDSIALTASCYSYHTLEDGEQPNKVIQLMWCILLILLPIALLFAESSMNNLQSVSIVAAFPIGAVIVMIAISFMKDAKKYMESLEAKEMDEISE